MDEETRQSAIEKADRISDHIGYPDELLDDGELERTFKEVKTTTKTDIFKCNYYFF